jgi:transposase
LSEIRRIEAEGPIEHFDDAAERKRRGIGRPSKAEPFREFVVNRLAQRPAMSSLELLDAAKLAGYTGSKSAFYALVARVRSQVTRSVKRVGEHPGDASVHGFGEVDVRFAGEPPRTVSFFVSQLSYSRWSEVTIVRDRGMESLLRALIDHFERIGGVPLLAVFDRHNASAIVTTPEGGIAPWHPAFAQTLLDLGVGFDLRGRGPTLRSGTPVERLVRWVKTSFFRGRRFQDALDLTSRLAEWTINVNTRTPARGTDAVPEARMSEERVRLRPLALRPDEFALRIPIIVGPDSEVTYEDVAYRLPEECAGKRAMLHVYRTKLRVVGPGFDVEVPRRLRSAPPKFPE